MTAPRVWFPGTFADDNFLSLVTPRAAGSEIDALTTQSQPKTDHCETTAPAQHVSSEAAVERFMSEIAAALERWGTERSALRRVRRIQG